MLVQLIAYVHGVNWYLSHSIPSLHVQPIFSYPWITLMADVMTVDTSGIIALEELHKELVSQSIQVRQYNVPHSLTKLSYFISTT